MDARLIRIALCITVLGSLGAVHKTPNFVVNAPTAEIAKQVGITAERSREELAVAWLGKPLPRWYKPCNVTVKVGQIGAGGATTFAFDGGEVFGWKMRVQGTLERILDSVIPHEVSHTIFASHFRRPLPRWADEGAATLIEHESERMRQKMTLEQVMRTSRRIPLQKLLSIKEYPRDMRDVLTLYAEGYSLADYLVQIGGKAKFLVFLEEAHRGGWNRAIRSQYQFKNVDALEKKWNGWVMAGSPALNLPDGQMLASTDNSKAPAGSANLVVRSQSPEKRSQAPKPRPRSLLGRLKLPTPGKNDGAQDNALASNRENARSRTRSARPNGPRNSQPLAREDELKNANWNTLANEKRRRRPQPLIYRELIRTNANQQLAQQPAGANASVSPNFSEDVDGGRDLPLTDLRIDERSRKPYRTEKRDSLSRSPNWSDFPQQRTGAGSVRPGNSFAYPSSP